MDRLRGLFREPNASWPELTDRLRKVEVYARSVALEVNVPEGLVPPDPPTEATNTIRICDTPVRLETRACMQPRKGTVTVSAPAARVSRAHFDRPLIAALRKAHRELANRGIMAAYGEALDHAGGLSDPHLRRIANLAFLAPDIQQSIVEGRQPAGLSLKRVIEMELPLDWEDQRERLGFNHL